MMAFRSEYATWAAEREAIARGSRPRSSWPLVLIGLVLVIIAVGGLSA